jgi:hypothetical protein
VTPVRLLVCGNRSWLCEATIRAWLMPIHRQWIQRGQREDERPTLIHGAQTTRDEHGNAIGGADYLAGKVARQLGWHVDEYPADWKRHKKAAGSIRNRDMAKRSHPNRGLAFGKLKQAANGRRSGTGDMVDVLNEMGVRVTVVAQPGDVP